jgi:cytochrome b subunit of formate dehydrogenase
MKRIKSYVRNEDAMEPSDVGFFNAGQKLQFWEIVWGCVAYVIRA